MRRDEERREKDRDVTLLLTCSAYHQRYVRRVKDSGRDRALALMQPPRKRRTTGESEIGAEMLVAAQR